MPTIYLGRSEEDMTGLVFLSIKFIQNTIKQINNSKSNALISFNGLIYSNKLYKVRMQVNKNNQNYPIFFKTYKARL